MDETFRIPMAEVTAEERSILAAYWEGMVDGSRIDEGLLARLRAAKPELDQWLRGMEAVDATLQVHVDMSDLVLVRVK